MSKPNARVQASTGADDPPRAVTVVLRRTNNRHEVGSTYTEEQWLPIIGPTGYLLAGQLTEWSKQDEDRVEQLAAALGVGAFRWMQALDRLVRFGLATLRVDPLDQSVLIITVLDRWPDAPDRKGAKP